MGDASFAGPANTTFIKDIASLWTICIAYNILVESYFRQNQICVKVNSVQEACANALKSCKPHEETKQKTSKC